jgi:hypothetical protein
MHETQIVPCSIHHSDHDDLIVFYHKMNDVGESFDQAGAETIGGYREQPWVFQDTINRCDVFSQELISQADLLAVVPKDASTRSSSTCGRTTSLHITGDSSHVA